MTAPKASTIDTGTQPIKNETGPAPTKRAYQPINYAIVTEMRAYFQQECGDSTRLQMEASDTMDIMTYYAIPKAKDDYAGFLTSVSLPKVDYTGTTGPQNVLHCDLNNDGIADEVITVYTEGDGGGGNVFTYYYFLYLTSKDTLKLAGVYTGFELSGCPSVASLWANNFMAKKIENGYLYGESYCYQDGDGHCCPSLHYATKVLCKNDKLVVAEKRQLPQREFK